MTASRQDVGTTTYTPDDDRALVITRVFDAPAQRVWDAFTRPEHVPNWMGPAKHAMTTCEIDLRVGGAWRYEYALEGGAALAHGGTYTEVDPPHRLVSTESFDDFPGESINTMTLTESGGLTVCELHCLFPTAEVRDMAAAAMKRGVDEGYARLDALLPTLA